MKAILLKDYKINGRAIAEAMWGTGGTNATRTNRRGAYYYSTSGHGGYVVNASCLTEEEKARINEYIEPSQIQVLVQNRVDGEYVIGVSLSNVQKYVGKNRNFRYSPSLGTVEWKDIDVYLFEEDCDWAILEKLTNIHYKSDTGVSEERRKEMVNSTFERWAKKKTPDGEK